MGTHQQSAVHEVPTYLAGTSRIQVPKWQREENPPNIRCHCKKLKFSGIVHPVPQAAIKLNGPVPYKLEKIKLLHNPKRKHPCKINIM